MRYSAFAAVLASGLVAASALSSSDVLAADASYGAGDIFTRLGVAKVSPKSDNGTIANGAYEVDVQSKTAGAFTLGYRFTDKLGVELLASERFEHDIELNGANLASTKHLPPTLTLQYYPLGGTQARVQPYAGIGVNYTIFSDEQLDIGTLELENSWGAAGQVGVDLLIDEHWALNAAAWYLDIDADAKVGGSDVGTVEIDPVVVMGGISYRF
ncbi:OmpW/AlkL family protein [Halomonas salinarum]|uniref:OmpW/AlkL family protein n=1 Tax=Halomonas salinarum TaxID=1158993 RepID=UPI0014398999|nr:OmpW family outer membrane protein [Halomonas salinarum]